jgi:hypothetical protein
MPYNLNNLISSWKSILWDSPFNQFFFPVSVDALQPHIILLLSGDSLVQTTGILFIWGEIKKKLPITHSYL